MDEYNTIARIWGESEINKFDSLNYIGSLEIAKSLAIHYGWDLDEDHSLTLETDGVNVIRVGMEG